MSVKEFDVAIACRVDTSCCLFEESILSLDAARMNLQRYPEGRKGEGNKKKKKQSPTDKESRGNTAARDPSRHTHT